MSNTEVDTADPVDSINVDGYQLLPDAAMRLLAVKARAGYIRQVEIEDRIVEYQNYLLYIQNMENNHN